MEGAKNQTMDQAILRPYLSYFLSKQKLESKERERENESRLLFR